MVDIRGKIEHLKNNSYIYPTKSIETHEPSMLTFYYHRKINNSEPHVTKLKI